MFVRGRTLSRVRIDMKRRHRNHHIVAGFTLPTIMIVSIVMFAVLATSVQFVSQSSSSLRDTYYDQLAREAAESGIVVADSCMDSGNTSWAQPLRPSSTCAGLATQCATAGCYIVSQNGLRTTYSVGTPTVSSDGSTLQSTGTVELLSSDGGVVRTFSANIKKARGGGAAGAEGGDATKRIATGSGFACAIASDGWVYCWGEGGAYKNLGNGKTTNEVAPVAISQGEIPVGVTFTSISASNTFTCGVASDGKAYCWGSGATGGGSGFNSGGLAIAVVRGDMPIGATIKQVSAGNDFACAVASDGKAYCWGSTAMGRLGDSTSVNYVTRNSPVAVVRGEIPVGVTIKSVSAGEEHACAIASNDKAYCWGAYRMGKLGINDPYVESYARPMAIERGVIPTTATIQSISAGSEHTCAIASNNKAYCWGYDEEGQLGIGSGSGAAYTPMAVSQGAMPANTAIRDISTSTLGGLQGSFSVGHSCAVTSIGGIYCWGSSVGIGVGNISASSSTPAAVMRSEQNPPLGQGDQSALSASTKIHQVSNGFQTTCVIASDDNVYCWGGLVAVDGSYTWYYGAPRVISKINMPTGVTFRPPSSTSGAGLLY